MLEAEGEQPMDFSQFDADDPAVQSMDYVNRYENRTIWGSGKDMENKWGAVKVIMRARPAGTSSSSLCPPACASGRPNQLCELCDDAPRAWGQEQLAKRMV